MLSTYELETLSRTKKDKFRELVLREYMECGVVIAIQLLKKSGICINVFGSGKPKDVRLFEDVISDLKSAGADIDTLERFLDEVRTLNTLYYRFNQKFMSKIEEIIPEDIHVVSYLIAMELSLRDIMAESSRRMATEPKSVTYHGGIHNMENLYENVTETTGMVLNYFLYKQLPFTGVSTKIDEHYMMDAQKHIDMSEIRMLLDMISEVWSYFNAEMSIEDTQGVSITAVGPNVLGKIISQMSFLDIANAKVSASVFSSELQLNKRYSKTFYLPPRGFVSQLEEQLAVDFVKDYLFIEDLSFEISGIPIAELIRAYSVVSFESEKFLQRKANRIVATDSVSLNEVCIVKPRNKWINHFCDFGISRRRAEKIFDLMVFGSKSRDILDCPFIKIDTSYAIVPSACTVTSIARAIMSNLSNKRVDLSVKGTEFEHVIRRILRNAGFKVLHLEETDFECDAVFAIDTDVFFVELKNLNHPVSYRDYMRNVDEINKACVQLERIVDYFMQPNKLESIQTALGLNRINSVTKILVTNTSQGENLNFNSTHVVDETLFKTYIRRTPPQVIRVNGTEIVKQALFAEYYHGKPSRQQFLQLIDNQPFIKLNQKRIESRTYDYTKEIGVRFTNLSIKYSGVAMPGLMSPEDQKEFDGIFGFNTN